MPEAPRMQGGDRLLKLTKEALSAPIEKTRVLLEELKRIDQSRRERGQELARTIFEISNKQRSLDLDLYVRTIREAVRDKVSEENQMILRTACEHFRVTYGQWCRDRGKSIEMLDNIVHRTGRETEQLMAKVILGFDVKRISRELWQLNLDKRLADIYERRTELDELTDAQLHELREEYNSIPAQDLAAELHDALHQSNLTDEPAPDVEAMRYLLRGRSAYEVKQIEFQFDERYHFVRDGEGEAPLREQIKQRLAPEDAAAINDLMRGFNSAEVARAVHRLLVHCSEASEVVEKDLELHPDFAGNFRRDYSGHPAWERELRAHEQVDALLGYVTAAQFKNVNRALEKYYGERLTPALYLCNRPFDPRRTAINLFKAFLSAAPRRLCRRDQDYLSHQQLLEIKARFRTSTHSEITKIVKKWADEQKARESREILAKALLPLENLSPEQVFEVCKHFRISTGMELTDFVQDKVRELCRDEVPKYVTRLVANRLQGVSRLALRADVCEAVAAAIACHEHETLESSAARRAEAEQDAAEVRRILEDRQESRKAKSLLAFLRRRSSAQLDALECAFLEQGAPPVPLIEAVRQKIKTKHARVGSLLLLSKFDAWTHAERLHKRPEYLLTLLTESPQAVAYMLREYRSMYKEDLQATAKSLFKAEDAARTLCQSVLLTQNVIELNKILKTKEPISDESLNFLVKQLTRPRLDVLAVEAAYNRYFARFEYCYDKVHGTLLQRLRVLATSGCLPRRHFASAILLLENVDPEIPMTMQNHLTVEEIGGETVLKFHALLRQFKDHLKILQKAYNALSEHATLRETIYELRIPLEVKNKTLLLLDGYDPDLVAREIRELVCSKLKGAELGEKILALLASGKKGAPNPRIPKQANWIEEMYHQIRVSYEAAAGAKLIVDLYAKEVPVKGNGINAIAYKLYGDASKAVIDLRRLLETRRSRKDELGVLDRRIVQTLADMLPPLRERALNMYDAYYARQPDHPDLLAELRSIKNKQVRLKALRLLQEALTWDVPKAPEKDGDGESAVSASS